MNAVTEKKQVVQKTSGVDQGMFWSDRYLQEGHIWGDDASITAQLLAERLAESSDSSVKTILEVGFGYGRDIKELALTGHKVVGIEVASAALTESVAQVNEYLNSGRVQLVLGDFNHTNYWQGDFDALTCHRMLHLLGNNGLVRAFANRAAAVLKDNGLLYVSARDPRDYNEQQMVMRGPNIAEYKDRPGHLISFWDKARFAETFGKKFEILDYVEGTEIESQKNPVNSHFTLMIARKRPENGSFNGAPNLTVTEPA